MGNKSFEEVDADKVDDPTIRGSNRRCDEGFFCMNDGAARSASFWSGIGAIPSEGLARFGDRLILKSKSGVATKDTVWEPKRGLA